MEDTSGNMKICSFDIDNLVGFDSLWQEVQARSTIPSEFEPQVFDQHINQLYMRGISQSLEAPPSQEIIDIEFQTENPMAYYCNHYPEPSRDFLSPANGMIRLRKFMNAPEERDELANIASNIFQAPVKTRGHFLYPPGGFKEWHTNYNHDQGWRMYIIDVDKDNESYFRYIDPDTGEMKTLWDKKGTVNFFHVDRDKPIWHCIKSESAYRFSRGFLVPDNWRDFIKLKSDTNAEVASPVMNIQPTNELRALRQQVSELKKENAVLKQAIAVLSKDYLDKAD
ncbi:MAG: hypothetical protein MI867_19610 [Pseudomonadales bacterium]|nr:hypothetical protein [Pseudomonadales bacterium]